MSRADGFGVVPSVGTERADMAGRAATGHAGSEPPDRAGAGCTEAWHAGGGGAVRLVDVGAGAYVAARRDTRTDGPCGVGRRTGHSGGGG